MVIVKNDIIAKNAICYVLMKFPSYIFHICSKSSMRIWALSIGGVNLLKGMFASDE
jgi:hypothetical protein